jgi:sugar lactone lactonase YvrE
MPDSHEASVGNAVAPLPNDAFAITINPAEALAHMRDPDTAAKLLKGEIPGRVMIWSPGTEWQEVPGSEMAGNNGMEATPDGKWLYVDALLERGVYRLSLGRTPVDRVVIKTTFYPDNIRWGDDGFLYVAGPAVTSRGIFGEAMACQAIEARAACPAPFKVLRIDPRTLESKELVNEPGSPLFGLATGVAKVGNELWVSSVRGTRIAVFPLK